MRQPQIAYALLSAAKKLREIGIELQAPEVDIDNAIVYKDSPIGCYVLVGVNGIQFIVVGHVLEQSLFLEKLFSRYILQSSQPLPFEDNTNCGKFIMAHYYIPDGAR